MQKVTLDKKIRASSAELIIRTISLQRTRLNNCHRQFNIPADLARVSLVTPELLGLENANATLLDTTQSHNSVMFTSSGNKVKYSGITIVGFDYLPGRIVGDNTTA